MKKNSWNVKMKPDTTPREKKILFWLLLALAVLLFFAVPMSMQQPVQAQERSNTYYAAQFPGADAGTKIANAQASCTNATLPCVIVIDAILSAWPQGTRPTPCATCMWMDYTLGGSLRVMVGTGGLIVQQTSAGPDGPVFAGQFSASSGFVPQTTGAANLGNTGARFAQLNIGDANGGVRWIGTGIYTASRTLTVPDGPSGTMMSAALTTTAATTDNVTVIGATSSSHCQLEPTNASAATNIATTFVSAKAANQITVTHTATAGMTYDVNCTGN